jgi:hypothetical protein
MTGADGTTAGIGVTLITSKPDAAPFDNQWDESGFRYSWLRVNNFTLEYSTVNGTNGTAAALAPPKVLVKARVFRQHHTTGMTGTGVITNCIISGGRSRTSRSPTRQAH